MASAGPKRRWLRWAWLLARGVVLGLLMMWAVWWVSWRWFANLGSTTYVVRRSGDQWWVREDVGLWEQGASALRLARGEQWHLEMTDVLIERLPNAGHDRLLESIEPGDQMVLYEKGRLWPALSGFEVYRPGVLLRQQSVTTLDPLIPGIFPTHVHWAGFIAWLGIFGLIGSGLWEAPKMACRMIARRRRARLGLCRHCGYSLEGISGVCPECGYPVDSASAASQSRGR